MTANYTVFLQIVYFSSIRILCALYMLTFPCIIFTLFQYDDIIETYNLCGQSLQVRTMLVDISFLLQDSRSADIILVNAALVTVALDTSTITLLFKVKKVQVTDLAKAKFCIDFGRIHRSENRSSYFSFTVVTSLLIRF